MLADCTFASLSAWLTWALDPVAFAAALGLTQPDPWQAQALRWSGQRLLLNVHRQGGKSTVAAILALHQALFVPGSLILLVSPSLRQSSELFRKVGDHLARLPHPPSLLEDNRLSLMLANKSRIVSLPSSEATIRGFSDVALIVEDEAARVPDELYAAVRPMLAVSGGRLILMSTPAGKIGHFWREWSAGEGWEKIKAVATECPRITPEFLAEEKRSLGERAFWQEYHCEFIEPENQVFGADVVWRAIRSDIRPLWG